MKAAVVSSFDAPPRYEEYAAPEPSGEHEIVVDMLAAGLHPRVRSQANGSHYTSTGALPLVPGVDGVGRGPAGELRYFLADAAVGTMAERAVVDVRRSVVLPEGSDPVAVAAAMNPAMSSWVALRRRVHFEAGQSVLVLGATGNAGRMAVAVAKRLGAGRVIAAGRDPERLAALPELGADVVVTLDALGAEATDVDVVVDYVWGPATAAAMTAVVTHRADHGAPLTWIEIGSMSGLTAAIPSAALRAARLQIVGSGQGSVPTSDILAEMPAFATEISAGTVPVDARPVPLCDVERVWAQTPATERIVLVP